MIGWLPKLYSGYGIVIVGKECKVDQILKASLPSIPDTAFQGEFRTFIDYWES